MYLSTFNVYLCGFISLSAESLVRQSELSETDMARVWIPHKKLGKYDLDIDHRLDFISQFNI